MQLQSNGQKDWTYYLSFHFVDLNNGIYPFNALLRFTTGKTVKAIDGVTKVDWYKETKVLKVTFDDSKVKLDDIRKKLAEVGHDNGDFKSDDAVYEALPACCHYRKK